MSNDQSNVVTDFRTIVAGLQKERQTALAKADTINETLREIRDNLNQFLTPSTPVKKVGRPRGRRPAAVAKAKAQPGNRGRGRPRRNGGESGTAIIERILGENSNEMDTSELARAAEKAGVKNPHSSYQSLKRRGRIEITNHRVKLVA